MIENAKKHHEKKRKETKDRTLCRRKEPAEPKRPKIVLILTQIGSKATTVKTEQRTLWCAFGGAHRGDC